MPASRVFPKLNRRRFLAASAAAGALAGLQYGVGKYVTSPAGAQPTGDENPLPVDTIVRTVCSPNCTGACGQNAWVRDGRIVKIEQAKDYNDAVYNPRGCMKGLSYIQTIYGPDRVRYPLHPRRASPSGTCWWSRGSLPPLSTPSWLVPALAWGRSIPAWPGPPSRKR